MRPKIRCDGESCKIFGILKEVNTPQDIGADTNDASVTDEHRHSLLHVNALEVVGRAKNDRQIHDIVGRHLKSAMTEIERLVDWRSNQPGYCSPTDNGSDSASDAEAVNGNSYGAAGISARMSDAEIENMRAPAVRLPQGRPICNKQPSALDKIRKGTKEKGSQSESLSVCEHSGEEGKVGSQWKEEEIRLIGVV
jgi:hypothetical protein